MPNAYNNDIGYVASNSNISFFIFLKFSINLSNNPYSDREKFRISLFLLFLC